MLRSCKQYWDQFFQFISRRGEALLFFGNKKIKKDTSYIKLQTAIDWHKTEIRQTKGKWRREALETLLDAHEKFKIEQTAISK